MDVSRGRRFTRLRPARSAARSAHTCSAGSVQAIKNAVQRHRRILAVEATAINSWHLQLAAAGNSWRQQLEAAATAGNSWRQQLAAAAAQLTSGRACAPGPLHPCRCTASPAGNTGQLVGCAQTPLCCRCRRCCSAAFSAGAATTCISTHMLPMQQHP